MEALECIKTRRSVRRFTEEPVTPEQVAEVVAAAAYAPSWKKYPDRPLYSRGRCAEA